MTGSAPGLTPKRACFSGSRTYLNTPNFSHAFNDHSSGLAFQVPDIQRTAQEVKNKDLHNFGFLGYPVLQAADIMVYKANAVPVGEDQLPHLELTREIARRFNNYYGNIFPEPQAILTKSPRVPGIDERKMSKSYGNAIAIGEKPEDIKKKFQQMFTDPSKIKANDIGHPEGCVVFAFHEIYNKDAKPSLSLSAQRERSAACPARKIYASF